MSSKTKSGFETLDPGRERTLLGEFLAMMWQHKKFWLAPIIIMLLVFGALIAFSSSAAAPFIYSLF